MGSISLSIHQSNNVKALIEWLSNSRKSPNTVHASPVKPGGILDLIYNHANLPSAAGRRLTFMGGITGFLPMWRGQAVTWNILDSSIKNDISGLFGPKFWEKVVMAGDVEATYSVSTEDDVIPNVVRYAAIYDKSGELAELREQLAELRSLISIVKNSKNKTVKNAVASTTLARWVALEKATVTNIAEIEAFK